MSRIRQLYAGNADFDAELTALLHADEDDRETVRSAVRDIIKAVRHGGDEVIVELTNRFDRRNVKSIDELEIGKSEMAAAVTRIDPLVREALESSIARVRRYHEQQKRSFGDQIDWGYEDEDGNELGQRVRGMERVGIYAPGGKASYPSTVIMTAVPARVAEAGEIILVVPAPEGAISDVLLAAANLCGIDRLFTMGGAQAVAALAYGTQTVPKVDKIVGPGNIYVATAKELVYGDVGIDLIAGPSEVVIVADSSVNPDWLVMDMFAQAEHDEMAQAILISTDPAVLDDIAGRIESTLNEMERARIIEASISDRGALILVDDLQQAASVVNRIAPEHLELAISDPDTLLPMIRHAGAIFIGSHTAEAIGDYCAGPSHVLPTSGTARFASPLGVYDFQVRSSIIRCSPKGAVMLGRDASILAREEGLEAHARSADYRAEG
ncbi:MAG: histidinol dehydrogenase [Pseudomonadales bacterium]